MLFREEVLRRQADRLHGSVVLTQSRATTGIVVALGLLIAGFLAFAFFGEYSRTETVKGILSTDPAAARISVARPGTVTDLFVTEGSEVKKGDRLMRVDTDVIPGEGGRVAEESVIALDQEADLQRRQAVDVRNSFRNSELQLDTQASDYASQIATFENQVLMQQRVIDSHRGILARAETVAERGFVSGLELERRRQALIQAEQQLASLNQQLTTARRSMQRARLEQAEMRNKMAVEINTLGVSVSKLQRERSEVAGTGNFLITSPMAGRVTALQLTEGQSATPAISAMTVVPKDAEIQAHLFAPTRAIGHVEIGQEVNLLVDAFPYQRFGNVKAKIVSVSATMIDPRQIDAPFKVEEPVFKVQAVLTDSSAEMVRRKILLQPGMTLQASIVLERRSFLEWLLSPLTAVTARNQ